MGDDFDTYYSSLVEVSPGEVLTGVISVVGPDGPGSFNYLAGFTGILEQQPIFLAHIYSLGHV